MFLVKKVYCEHHRVGAIKDTPMLTSWRYMHNVASQSSRMESIHITLMNIMITKKSERPINAGLCLSIICLFYLGNSYNPLTALLRTLGTYEASYYCYGVM